MGQKFAEYDAQRSIVAFYDEAISVLPGDAQLVAITDEQHQALLAGQSKGRRLAVDENGVPVLTDQLPMSVARLAEMKRATRETALAATDWLVGRHQDELMTGDETTLAQAQLDALLAYRKALRDLPSVEGWPSVDLPVAPEFIAAGV
ncbi:phage tail assembly chaperone [Trinickia sp. YCB016]